MANPTIAVLTDTFNRSPKPSGGSYSTGVANSNWAVGNDWVDLFGGAWSLSASGRVQITKSSGGTSGAHLVNNPALTPGPNQRIVLTTEAITTLTTAVCYAGVLRVQPYSPTVTAADCYYAQVTGAGNLQVYKIIGGTATQIGSNVAVALVSGHQIKIDFQVTGDGATTTTFAITVYDVTAGNTVLGTFAGTDTTAELQSGGRAGLSSLLTPGPTSLGFTQAIIYSDTPYTLTNVPFGEIGDSLTYGLEVTMGPVGEIEARILTARNPGKRYIANNCGQSGSQTSDWLPTDSKGYLANAVTQFQAAGVQFVEIALGSNDARVSVPVATWLANMQTIINYVAAALPGVQIIVHAPPYFDAVRFNNYYGGTALTANTTIGTYVAAIGQLTGVTIGDTYAYTTFKNFDFAWLADGGHPNDQGAPQLAILRANAVTPGVAMGTSYPVAPPIGRVANGKLYATVPWLIPANGIPGSTGVQQQGYTSYVISASAANELCNLLDRMIEDGRAALT